MADSFSPGFVVEGPDIKVPMHPEDYLALLEWVREKKEKRTLLRSGSRYNP